MSAPTLLLAGGGTGGHVFPLVAVADALKALAPELRLVFVGTERGMETRFVPARGYELELVSVIPIRGGGITGAAKGVWRAMMSIPESRALLSRLAPSAVLSIGGYAAGPVSLAARLAGIPLALVEPNSVMGLANRLTVPLVQRAYTAFEETERHFRADTVLATGVPIRAGFEPQPYALDPARVRILVIGGSQGAKALNETVPDALCRVRSNVSVVHQCGQAHVETVRERYAQLSPKFELDVVPFIDEMPAALGHADLVISRAGAGAVSEIAAVGRPALFVPYPYAAGDHQRKNAEALARAGAAVCVPSAEASVDRLAGELGELTSSAERLGPMAEASRRWGRPHAADAVARDLLALAGLASRVESASKTHGASGDASGSGATSRFAEVS